MGFCLAHIKVHSVALFTIHTFHTHALHVDLYAETMETWQTRFTWMTALIECWTRLLLQVSEAAVASIDLCECFPTVISFSQNMVSA